MEKMNLAQQKHAFSNQKKSTVIQNKQKTEARFSRLLQLAAWKPSGSSLQGKDKYDTIRDAILTCARKPT